jgi:hypothetical protein
MSEFSTTVSDSFFARWCPNPTRIYDLGEIYAEFNARFFNGELPVLRFTEHEDENGEIRRAYPQIKWNGKYRKLLGTYKPNGRGTGEIRLARYIAPDPVQVRSTLLHEMVHAYLDKTKRDDGIKGHGPNFILEASRINAQCSDRGLAYRVNFYDVPVTKEEPEVYSDLLGTTIYCGKDLDLARKMRTILNASFDTRYVYEQ